MRSHYAVEATIRYYKTQLTANKVRVREARAFDFSRWKDAPHIALANLRDEPEAVSRFIQTYGALGHGQAWSHSVLEHRDELRRAWEGDTFGYFSLAITQPLLVAKPTGLVISVDDPLTLVQIMFAQDWEAGLLRKCENPDCPAPYFRAVRKGQKFCSQKCAVLINVRHFREREAKAAKKKRGKA